jgi:hypothetical protein
LGAGRPSTVIDLVGSYLCLHKSIEYDRDLSIEALRELLSKQDEMNSFHVYNIGGIIEDLQSSDVPKEELINIEWAYLSLLTGVHSEGRPITLETEIANNPARYNEILCIAYKAHSVQSEDAASVDKNIAKNAWLLLHYWRIVPGTTADGKIDRNKLNTWYEKMVEICSESDRLNVGLMNFGHVLFHAPTNKNGTLNKYVAEILNEDSMNAKILRDSYRTEAFNSLGVISIDADGTVYDNLADKYAEKARVNEKAGYSRIATIFRNLSETYREDAKETRDRYEHYD